MMLMKVGVRIESIFETFDEIDLLISFICVK